MIKEIILLSIIGLITYLYNKLIYGYVLMIFGEWIYNNIIIYMIILIQIDNISLYNELKNGGINTNDNIEKIHDKYMKILMNQMTYIIKQNNDIKTIQTTKKNKYKYHNSFINKSCNDLHNMDELKND